MKNLAEEKSAEKFAPWRSRDVDSWLSQARASEAFAPYFDFDAPSPAVGAQGAFSFYEPEAADP